MAARGVVRTAGWVLAVLMLTAAGWGSWGRFHGTVVDFDTGEPISEAVIVFEWVKRHRLGTDGPAYVQNVQEVVTDAEGRFSVKASPGINWNPLTYLRRLQIVVFAVDYQPAAPALIVTKDAESTTKKLAMLEKGVQIPLKPLNASSRIREMVSHGAMGLAEGTRHRAPNLNRVIDEQRRRRGLED